MKKTMHSFNSLLFACVLVLLGTVFSKIFALAYLLVIIGHYKLCACLMQMTKDPAFAATFGFVAECLRQLKMAVASALVKIFSIDADALTKRLAAEKGSVNNASEAEGSNQ